MFTCFHWLRTHMQRMFTSQGSTARNIGIIRRCYWKHSSLFMNIYIIMWHCQSRLYFQTAQAIISFTLLYDSIQSGIPCKQVVSLQKLTCPICYTFSVCCEHYVDSLEGNSLQFCFGALIITGKYGECAQLVYMQW